MKKSLIVLLLLLLVSSLVFANGANETTASVGKKTEMSLWLAPMAKGKILDADFWNSTLKPWADENNVNLTIEIVPWSGYEEKYLTSFAAGQGPDVGYMYREMFNDYIDMGILEDLGKYFSQEERENYLYWDNSFVKGGNYAIPLIVGNTSTLFCNMDILNKAGVTSVPTTWDELLATAIKIKEANIPGVIPFAQDWANPTIGSLNNIFYPFLWQAGGDIYNDEGNKVVLLENNAAVKAAQFLYDMKFKYGVITDECMALDASSFQTEFANGKIAMAHYPTSRAIKWDNAGINWDYCASLQDVTKGCFVASDSLIMNSGSKNKELAASLIKYITSGETMNKVHTQLVSYPPLTKDEPYTFDERLKPIFDNYSEYFHAMPIAKGAFKVMDSLHKNLQLMMLGDLTPEQAIKNTVEYSNSVLNLL